MFSLLNETLEDNEGRQIIELADSNIVLTGFLGGVSVECCVALPC